MKLAADLGVGTTAVREALFELEAQGFVTRLTNKGTFVTQLSKEDVAQILTVRRELEGLAVQLLEERATEEHIASMRRIVGEMRTFAGDNDIQSFYPEPISSSIERYGHWQGIVIWQKLWILP